jgi:hypothetical protein
MPMWRHLSREPKTGSKAVNSNQKGLPSGSPFAYSTV